MTRISPFTESQKIAGASSSAAFLAVEQHRFLQGPSLSRAPDIGA
jgi:hypothetical protein